jgi:hypothetical protein
MPSNNPFPQHHLQPKSKAKQDKNVGKKPNCQWNYMGFCWMIKAKT